MTAKIHILVPLVALAATLAACSGSEGDEAGTQVLARVNGNVILARQFNRVVEYRGAAAEESVPQTPAETLERAIDEELLVQSALRDHLERIPAVTLAIEGARRQILAQAYIERAVAAAPAQDPESIKAFYMENPALFGRRRVYNLNELLVEAPPEKLAALQAVVDRTQSMSDIARWLNTQQLPFQARAASRSAEHIPMNTLSQLLDLREGQIAVVAVGPRTSIVQLLRADEAPMNEAQASPVIARYLANRRRLEVSRAELGRLRERANIEYVRRFVPLQAGLR